MTQPDLNDAEPLMAVTDVSVHYQVRNEAGERVSLRAVDGVSFEVRRGQTVGLVGESRCGKSTLGRALVQVENLASGSIYLGGVKVSGLPEREMLQHRRRLQMIFQNPQASLNPRWKIGRSVQEPLRVHETKSVDEQRASVLSLLDRVGLSGEIVEGSDT